MNRLNQLRAEVVKDIYRIVSATELGNILISEIDEGCSPIIDEDEYDENNTYTLDYVYIENDRLFFDGSSSYANYTWNQDNLSVDALCNVLEFLEDHEEKIKEFWTDNKSTLI